MALSITTSSVLRTPSNISNPGAGEVESNISSADHSLTYTTGAGGCEFLWDPDDGSSYQISYLAISGHNLRVGDTVTVEYGALLLGAHTIQRGGGAIMITWSPIDFDSAITVTISPTDPARATTISYMVGGLHMEIDTGEQAGYKRLWLNRNVTRETTTNMLAAPVSTLTKRVVLKGSLSLPNQTAEFSQGEWQAFIGFTFEYPFFIKEIEGNPDSSYVCFDPLFSTSSHSQTRALDSLTVSFKAYNGL